MVASQNFSREAFHIFFFGEASQFVSCILACASIQRTLFAKLFLPPASAVEVNKMEPSVGVCVCVCLSVCV